MFLGAQTWADQSTQTKSLSKSNPKTPKGQVGVFMWKSLKLICTKRDVFAINSIKHKPQFWRPERNTKIALNYDNVNKHPKKDQHV